MSGFMEKLKERPGAQIIAGAVIAAVLGGIVTAILISVIQRKAESKYPFHQVVEITDDTYDPATWGLNFPYQYASYKRTTDMIRTRHGGSEAMPRTPTDADPRSIVARSKVEDDPRLRAIWAGYAFAVDTREARGHAYMLEDQTFTERTHVVVQPGTCINCHASAYPTYKALGDGDITRGFEVLNAMDFHEAREHVEHPVACIDCHVAESMELRITRPAFMEGIASYMENVEGRRNYDVNRDASRQEMRTYVCAQCHVEYYFALRIAGWFFPGQRDCEPMIC